MSSQNRFVLSFQMFCIVYRVFTALEISVISTPVRKQFPYAHCYNVVGTCLCNRFVFVFVFSSGKHVSFSFHVPSAVELQYRRFSYRIGGLAIVSAVSLLVAQTNEIYSLKHAIFVPKQARSKYNRY